MLDCVPEPVCQTTNGKLSSNLPSTISCAASAIAWPTDSSNFPSETLANAADFFCIPNARTI